MPGNARILSMDDEEAQIIMPDGQVAFVSVYDLPKSAVVGQSFSVDEGEAGITMKPVAPSEDDFVEFFSGRSASADVTAEHIKKMDATFAERLRTAISDAEKATGAKAELTDTFRSTERQARYYNAYKSGKGGLAARPGRSRHQRGAAADIKRGPVLDWLHKNAGKYGLEFLSGNAFKKDPVHIQLAGSSAASSPKAATPRPPHHVGSLDLPVSAGDGGSPVSEGVGPSPGSTFGDIMGASSPTGGNDLGAMFGEIFSTLQRQEEEEKEETIRAIGEMTGFRYKIL